MTRQIIRSVVIFWGIVAIFLFSYLLYGYFVSNVLPRRNGLESVTTWLDSNANGIRDPGEKNLPNVCVWDVHGPADGDYFWQGFCRNIFTDANGEWSKFLPEESCDEYFILAEAPKGFHTTTNVVSNGCKAEIGFVQDSIPVNHKVVSFEEYVRQQIFYSRLKKIVTGVIILMIGIIGTIWLEKSPKRKRSVMDSHAAHKQP